MWNQVKDANWRIPYVGGWCEGYVEGAWGVATLPTINNQTTEGVYGSAMAKWNANPGNGNHPGEQPPIGKTVAVYFSLGSTPDGHTAISLDDGTVASSTQAGFHTQGYLHPNLQAMMDMYGQYNNGCTYLGWSEYVGNTQVLALAQVNATVAEIQQDYLDILERPADQDGINHYLNYTNDFVREDLLNSQEYKTLQANKAAAAQAAAAASQPAPPITPATTDPAQVTSTGSTLSTVPTVPSDSQQVIPPTVPETNVNQTNDLLNIEKSDVKYFVNLLTVAWNWIKSLFKEYK